MIHTVLELITEALNQHLRIQHEFSENMALLSGIVEPDGSVIPAADNKLLVSLVSIEKDTSMNTSPVARRKGPDVVTTTRHAGIHLNLYIMMSANFTATNYAEGLKILSHTIGFFQKQPVFTRSNMPDLDTGISKLMFSIENLSIKDLSSLWSVISNKYVPSVLYKVRLVTIDMDALKQQTPPVTDQVIKLSAR
jgi:hypothetical protein